MRIATLVFLRDGSQILLAMKKRGFGAGRWNGVGGKVEPGETLLEAARREAKEEIGIDLKDQTKVAHINFYFPDGSPDWLVHVFESRDWSGNPVESEEMAPQWFHTDDIPYYEMWSDDEHWLPHILKGKKLIGHFNFDETEQLVPDSVRIEMVESFADE